MSSEECERHGEHVLLNGEIYVGTFEGLLPNGVGKYTWLDGTIYEGEWERSRIIGKGQICWPSGATYEGEFSGGFLHGSGTFTGVDGSTYFGSWRMNVQHGTGRKTYPNSDTYDGQWKEGHPDGIGRYTWSNGNIYVGNWKEGKMNGRGFMKWANGDIFYGVWLDGLQNGAGYHRFSNGAFYFGTWNRALKDGSGTFYPTGSLLLLKQRYPESASYNSLVQTLCPASALGSEGFMCMPFCGQKSGSCKWHMNCIFRNSGRMSHRRTTPGGLWDLDDPAVFESNFLTLSCPTDEAEYEIQDENIMVYEREYLQGVLVRERIRLPDSEVSKKKNEYHKILMKQPRRPGETIYKGHRSYFLMLNLQLGIRYTVGKITPVPMREVLASDFGSRARIRMYFPSKGSQFTPPHTSVDFYWKDYCPMVFRNLRQMFKINAADYMMSICGGDGLKELSSPGKSGSIFYLSQDERFVIKTLRKKELKILLKMLPKYYDHVGAYDNTLITKFFGLHRLSIRGRKVLFVVMGNMFCTELPIHRRFDLKGSKHGRSTSKHKINEYTTLKDLDLSYVFHLEKSWRESLFRQITLDCMFLESQCIVDYSMLLGLHFRAPEHLRVLLEHQSSSPQKTSSSSANDSNAPTNGEVRSPLKGFVLVAHEPSSASTLPGSHIRGSTLRAPAAGNEEVDLLLSDVGRLRVQLGVNMPAEANRKALYGETEDATEDLLDSFDVVLYFGIIDILQDYNMTKRFEHSFKSLKLDPATISSVEPQLYSKRFISFLERVFPES